MIGSRRQQGSDPTLPRFLVVEPGEEGRLEAYLAPYLDLGCPLLRASSLRAALGQARELQPDLVLVDVAAGVEGLDELRSVLPTTSVMVVGPRSQRVYALQALDAGAHEWLPSDPEDQPRSHDAIERLLLLGPRPALPRRPRSGEPAPEPRVPLAGLMRAPRLPPPPAPGTPADLGPAASTPPRAELPPLPPVPAPLPPLPALPASLPAPVAHGRGSPAVSEAAPLPPVGGSGSARRLVRLFEVAENGGPAHRARPKVLESSFAEERAELVLDCPEGLEAGVLLLGFQLGERIRWGSYEVLSRTPEPQAARGGVERLRLSLRRERGPGEFLAPARLLPVFDPAEMRYLRPLVGDAARAWVELGVLRELRLDRVFVCPRCHCLPTFRHGCRQCGSARVEGQRLIHHFPCAHVARQRDFQIDGLLVCPKCAARPLIVNADFEYLDGPFVCEDCAASDSEAETIGHCFGCGLRFLSRLAATLDLVGFDADRLDPVDLQLPS